MRKLSILFLVVLTCMASATIKDPRHNLKAQAPLSQEEVAKQQALQKQQGEVGGVPQKTDDAGNVPTAQSDSEAAAALASHQPAENSSDAVQGLRENDQVIHSAAERPKKTAFGILWALFAGLLLAFAVWGGLQKYGPKPPDYIR